MRQRGIDGEPVNPGSNRRLAAEFPNVFEDLDEDFLTQLLGVLIPANAQDEVIDPSAIEPVQALLRRAITRPAALDEDRLAARRRYRITFPQQSDWAFHSEVSTPRTLAGLPASIRI